MLARHALSDVQWERIELLLPTAGPRRSDRRRFIDAVLWVARTGAAWRDLPDRFGNWNSVWRRFDRWAAGGVWARLFDALQDGDLERLVLDSTIVRAHPAAAGAKRGPAARPRRHLAAAAAASGPRSTPR
jgi:transposase